MYSIRLNKENKSIYLIKIHRDVKLTRNLNNISLNQTGRRGIPGDVGSDGLDGSNGYTPYIQGGNWWINGVDTGVIAEGANGVNGSDGSDGAGVATGGTAGQYLTRVGETDFNTEWSDLPAIPDDISDLTDTTGIIPTTTSDLTNDSSFITGADVPTNETDPIFSASEAASFVTGDASKLYGIEAGAEVNNISDTDATDLTDGGETTLHSHAGMTTDEKVKYDANDTTAGYIADKVIAGDGITVTEGTGASENKLVITNSDKGSDFTETDPLSLHLDQTTPQTITGLIDGDVSINGSKLVTRQYAHTYYVSKIGSDSHTGKSEGTAFLTIGKALESCVSGDIVNVLDGEAYNETLIIPVNITVDMRCAELSGQVILATNSKIFVLKHHPSTNDEIMISCIGTSGSLYTCLAGQSSDGYTGIIHFKPSVVGGFIIANIEKITVGDGNTLVYSSAGSSGINIATTPASFSSDKALNYGTPADLVYGDSGYCQWDISAVSFPVAITYNIGTGTTVTMYKIVGTTSTTRGPKNWTLEGKLGAGDWETIDTQTDITWTSSEQKEFTIGTPASYDQYRVTVASSSNAGWLQIADMGFWAGVASVGGDVMISSDIVSLGEDSYGVLAHDEFQRVITDINNVYQETDTEDATFIDISDGIVSHKGNAANTDILWNKTGGNLAWDVAFSSGTKTGTADAYTLTQANIEDSVTDGHTTIAPSGNAVFDALAGKQGSLGYTPVNKAGDTMSGNLTIYKGSPSVTFINTDSTQYSTSANKMYQNAPTFTSQAGINFGVAVTDTGATSTKFIIDRVDYTGVFSANVFAIDLPTRVATFHGNVTPSLNNSKGLGTSSLYWSNLYATKNYLNSTAIIDGTNAGIIYMTATAASGTAFYAGASTSGTSFEINNNNTDAKLAVKSTVAGKAAYVYLQSLGNYRSLRGDSGGGILHFSIGQFGGTQFVIRTNSDGYTGSVDAQALQIDGSQQTTFNPANANSSVYFYPVQIKPTLTQSGTAGYTALLINPTETATGSGVKNLIDAQVGGVSKFKVNNTGLLTAVAFSAGANAGVDGTFTTADSKTVTVTKGIITAIV